jgi:hypothetical protein
LTARYRQGKKTLDDCERSNGEPTFIDTYEMFSWLILPGNSDMSQLAQRL